MITGGGYRSTGSGGARLVAALAVRVSRHTALRALLRVPETRPRAPRAIDVEDFTLRRRHHYATVLIDTETAGPAATRSRGASLRPQPGHSMCKSDSPM